MQYLMVCKDRGGPLCAGSTGFATSQYACLGQRMHFLQKIKLCALPVRAYFPQQTETAAQLSSARLSCASRLLPL